MYTNAFICKHCFASHIMLSSQSHLSIDRCVCLSISIHVFYSVQTFHWTKRVIILYHFTTILSHSSQINFTISSFSSVFDVQQFFTPSLQSNWFNKAFKQTISDKSTFDYLLMFNLMIYKRWMCFSWKVQQSLSS